MSTVDFFLWFAIGLAIAPIVIGGFLMMLGMLFDLFAEKELQHCDIDPRCHPAFAWAKDGTGWIGNMQVLR